jgi:hypothetical protein
MSENKKGTGIGETNSQYGTCWITKDGENKKIKGLRPFYFLKKGSLDPGGDWAETPSKSATSRESGLTNTIQIRNFRDLSICASHC